MTREGFIEGQDVGGAVEEEDGANQLGQGDYCIEALEPFQGCTLLLPPPLIGCHVEMGECHLEECIGNSVLVVFGNIDNVHVPSNHQRDRSDIANDHLDDGIDKGAGEVWGARGQSWRVFSNKRTNSKERRKGGRPDQDPGHHQEQDHSSACQNSWVPEIKLMKR